MKAQEQARKCISCGYNLRGLGEEPRCPECGLLNIPEGLRRQVQEAVDAKPWFFSAFSNPFGKRLPGWWWSLDRQGDVGRSFKFAGAHILVCLLIVVGLGIIPNSIVVDSTTHYFLTDPDDPSLEEAVGMQLVVIGVANSMLDSRETLDENRFYTSSSTRISATSKTRLEVSLESLLFSFGLYVWAISVWACPSHIGIWTQIRKGLPEFAKAPRTIIAASNYEAHRLTYLAIVMVAGMACDAGVRITLYSGGWSWARHQTAEMCFLVLSVSVVAFAVLEWIGPIRSDYTRQLIRSWFHGLRILLMYALFFPGILALAFAALVAIAFF